jgi:hypothetical protein
MTGAAGEARSHPQPGSSIDEASAHPRLGKVGADPMHGLPPTLAIRPLLTHAITALAEADDE